MGGVPSRLPSAGVGGRSSHGYNRSPGRCLRLVSSMPSCSRKPEPVRARLLKVSVGGGPDLALRSWACRLDGNAAMRTRIPEPPASDVMHHSGNRNILALSGDVAVLQLPLNRTRLDWWTTTVVGLRTVRVGLSPRTLHIICGRAKTLGKLRTISVSSAVRYNTQKWDSP
ncbi:hypothetical protein BT67DRAFT_102136 [Trichocladium antarcticum]|uniref:Uncharacterized protein n=1 Tax=Trichocladium antarcticum TaxID=1450529 RepID=A0AAN6UQF0_9PEZI|nr:hypothetical protein BT67DRAFT_102136 [Trichocladium antarcticum]